MKSKILSWGAFVLGLALIICGWFLLGDRTVVSNFVLNIVVSVVIYCFLFMDLLISWRKPEDKADSRIGNTGLRWGVVFIYIAAAVVIMILSNVMNLSFLVRLFLHGIAVVGLVAGFAMVSHSATNMSKVDTVQREERAGVELMRRELKALHYDVMDKGGIPQEIISRINNLLEEMRFISPSNSDEAKELEDYFVNVVGRARLMVSSYTLEAEALAAEVAKIERVLKDRKSVYSN